MEIREMDLEQLAAGMAEDNPRRDLQPGDVEYERIKTSLGEFGMVQPYVWNEQTGELVAGHQRLKIQLADGVETEYAVVVDLPKDRSDVLRATLNSEQVQGGWDPIRFQEEIRSFARQQPDLYDTLGFADLDEHRLATGDLVPGEDEEEATDADLDDGEEVGEGPPEMKLQAFEHYDYVVLLFNDKRDWLNAAGILGLQKVRDPIYTGSKKIGIGRALPGPEAIRRIREAAAEGSDDLAALEDRLG